MKRPAQIVTLLLMLSATVLAAQSPGATPEEALATARELAEVHRYRDALLILEPLVTDDLRNEISWEITAEAGRAAFHQGQYRKADTLFRRVVQARPIVVEPALYLEATSYLLGDHRPAFSIFEAILRSGARDLYLAVTLPGEKRFLAEGEVQDLLKKYAVPLKVQPASATIQGVRLGQQRTEISSGLGVPAAPTKTSTLVARAGPLLTWIFSFDDDDLLTQIVLDADHLHRYTPYTLDLAGGISWTSTPLSCIQLLGQANTTSTTDDDALIMTWVFPKTYLDLVFSRPASSAEEVATLEMIRMYRRPPQGQPGE